MVPEHSPPMSPWPPWPATCQRCGTDAPIVYRGVVPHCTACGALRVPLSGPSVNLAGRPARVGGAVASVFGWLVLLIGGAIAAGIGLLFAAFHLLGVARPLALTGARVSIGIGGLLVRRGALLHREGSQMAQATRERALLALLEHRGSVHAVDAARTLGVSLAEADAMLTDLAKRSPDTVAVDVEDSGGVAYRLVDSRVRVGAGPRVDVASSAGEASGGGGIEEAAQEAWAPPAPRTVPRS